jgi:inner membrane protein
LDNITHTFVGLALAETGLKSRTALGTATLAIGANFPDIDVIAVPLGKGFEWRRGTTHGFLALAILPFVLAGIMWLSDKYFRRRSDPSKTPADFRQLAILSAISIATHPILDFMNEYGMRWLMPFVDKWFYADGLYIVDVWLFAALVAGVLWSRYRGSTRPARLALAVLATYTTLMLIITGMGRQQVAAVAPGRRFMVAPSGPPVTFVPWARQVLIEEESSYRFGWYSPSEGLQIGTSTLAKGAGDPAVALALRTQRARDFLRWARFPFYRVVQDGKTTVVRIADARYSGDAATGWASIEVRLP